MARGEPYIDPGPDALPSEPKFWTVEYPLADLTCPAESALLSNITLVKVVVTVLLPSP